MMHFASDRRLLPLVLLLVGGFVLAQGVPVAPRGNLNQVEVGMTARQVRDIAGEPARIARQLFYQGTLEQWIYELPQAGRVEILHRLGREPKVVAVRRK
jgi:hypothetical protein